MTTRRELPAGARAELSAVPAGFHGTAGAIARHKKLGEPSCEECRAFHRGVMRDLRARRGPEYDRWWSSTKSTALRLLAAEYPGRFSELLAEVRGSGPTPWDAGGAHDDVG